MSDLISRQVVLDAIRRISLGQTDAVKVSMMTEEYVKAIPPVNPWIPISERMSEDGQSVLFCDIDNDIMVGYHVKGRPNTHFSQDGTYEDMKNVRAWMPLPKPYRAESEIHCNCTDVEIAKSFIEDVGAVIDLLPQAESEDKE